MSVLQSYYEKQANTIIKALKKRGMDGHYCPDSKSAVTLILSMIPEGSTITWGGSESIKESGLLDALKQAPVELWDRSTVKPEDMKAFYRKAFCVDYFLMSSNAITLDGQLVNIDGTGNRMAAVIWGPDKVVFIVGANKIVASVDDAVDRIRCDACPPNCIRLGKNTPCAATGKCAECLSLGNTVCCHTVITRFSSIPDRMHVIMVNENLGF